MTLAKRIAAYPPHLTSAITRLANLSTYREVSIPHPSKRAAVNERARLYHLRKLLAEDALHRGNHIEANKIYSVGIRLTVNPDNTATLTVFNQYSPVSSTTLNAFEQFLEETAPLEETKQSPFTPEQLRELEEVAAAAQSQIEKASGAFSQYETKLDPNDFEPPSEEDRQAFEETRRRTAKDFGPSNTTDEEDQ